MTPLAVGQERSVQLVNDALGRDRMLVMVASKDSEIEQPGPDDLYRVGVAGTIARMLRMPDGTLRILVQGGPRVRIDEFVSEQPYLVARIHEEPDVIELSSELEALTRHIQTTFSTIIEGVPYLPEELQIAVANLDDPEALGHLIAGSLRIRVDEKQELLEEANVTKRLRRLSEILARELEVMELGSKIQSEVQSEMDKTQREYFLREQMKAIQRELGEEDETQAEINELREQMEEAGLPEEVRKQAERELSRLEKLPPAAAEHGVIRTYLEWILDLPWSKSHRGQPRHRARAQGARRRPLRHREGQGPDPRAPRGAQAEARRTRLDPVVRGTARRRQDLARQVDREGARAQVRAHLGRRRARRGRDPRSPPHLHRRAAGHDHPGAARRRSSNNPVFMIDEIDKMGADFRGDPASAMLEVLDPEQNHVVPRPLPRSAVRPLARDVHHDGEHPRHDSGTAARPHGGDPALRLHGRGEARDRAGATWSRARSSATGSRPSRSRSRTR